MLTYPKYMYIYIHILIKQFQALGNIVYNSSKEQTLTNQLTEKYKTRGINQLYIYLQMIEQRHSRPKAHKIPYIWVQNPDVLYMYFGLFKNLVEKFITMSASILNHENMLRR